MELYYMLYSLSVVLEGGRCESFCPPIQLTLLYRALSSLHPLPQYEPPTKIWRIVWKGDGSMEIDEPLISVCKGPSVCGKHDVAPP